VRAHTRGAQALRTALQRVAGPRSKHGIGRAPLGEWQAAFALTAPRRSPNAPASRPPICDRLQVAPHSEPSAKLPYRETKSARTSLRCGFSRNPAGRTCVPCEAEANAGWGVVKLVRNGSRRAAHGCGPMDGKKTFRRATIRQGEPQARAERLQRGPVALRKRRGRVRQDVGLEAVRPEDAVGVLAADQPSAAEPSSETTGAIGASSENSRGVRPAMAW
jgi:hypothetical protein